MELIELKNIQTNNLKNIDIEIPLGSISVVTGVSGSGKSSLVFDTLYAESYRRYVESLSSFARQYLKSFPKPKVGKVVNLPPSIAVKQSSGGGINRRSTVGTLTEALDLLRAVFTNLSEVQCFSCQKKIEKENGATIAKKISNSSENGNYLICAPLKKWQKTKASDLKKQIVGQGFTRLFLNGEVKKIEEVNATEILDSYVVVDRIKKSPNNHGRFIDSTNIAIKLGRGIVYIVNPDLHIDKYSADFSCADCQISYYQPSLALFSFNHPLGACKNCNGFGMESEIDWEKVFPDHSSSMSKKGIIALNFGQHEQFYLKLKKFGELQGIEFSKSFEDYSELEWNWIKFGDGKKFFALTAYFQWLDTKKYKPHYRMHAARFRKYVICKECHGERLNRIALSCKIEGINIGFVNKLSIDKLELWISSLLDLISVKKDYLPEKSFLGVEEAIAELKSRLDYLIRIGVGYLTLDRISATLSGGELQRINMARCLGSSLTDTLFCLDEPTAGLHVRDSQNLMNVISDLKNQGNTIVIVEHEKNVIRNAGYLIEIGPKAGHLGGELVYCGSPEKWSSTYIENQVNSNVSTDHFKFIELKNITTQNLKSIDISIPVGKITVVCGVSGSGKTSLVKNTLYPMFAKELGTKIGDDIEYCRADSIEPKKYIEYHSEILLVGQESIGKSSRSNIATYLGIYDGIRKLFAAEPLSIKFGLKPGAFSFNVSGGRCENCKGLGEVEEDLSFLGNVWVICPVCEGKKFSEEVLTVKYRNKNLTEVLNMTVEQAREFFYDAKVIANILDEVIKMGLGYLTLGQATNSFSGGESQRLKLISLLKKVTGSKPYFLIFDEPTTGLSDFDVENLLSHLSELSKMGHTIVLVEHHLNVIKFADWVIELGPEAAERGGQLLFEGPPLYMLQHETSILGKFLS